MFELAKRARWLDVLDLLESGKPPLYIQLLIANIAFLVYFILRGMFHKEEPNKLKIKPRSRYRAEFMVILVNAAILYEHSWLPFFQGSAISIYIRNLLQL
jgi:hypothetical protein